MWSDSTRRRRRSVSLVTGTAGRSTARARAEALPCADDAFDAVLLCLALEHVEAFELAIHEVARVLEPGGRFVLLLAHPLLQAPRSGWVEDQSVGEHSWRIGSYLVDDIAVDTVAPGVELLFVHRPLSRYVHALGEAGLLIEDMEEPPPAPLVVDAWDFPEAATIPRVLLIRARLDQLGGGGGGRTRVFRVVGGASPSAAGREVSGGHRLSAPVIAPASL